MSLMSDTNTCTYVGMGGKRIDTVDVHLRLSVAVLQWVGTVQS